MTTATQPSLARWRDLRPPVELHTVEGRYKLLVIGTTLTTLLGFLLGLACGSFSFRGSFSGFVFDFSGFPQAWAPPHTGVAPLPSHLA